MSYNEVHRKYTEDKYKEVRISMQENTEVFHGKTTNCMEEHQSKSKYIKVHGSTWKYVEVRGSTL
jgi:hypothetical protein